MPDCLTRSNLAPLRGARVCRPSPEVSLCSTSGYPLPALRAEDIPLQLSPFSSAEDLVGFLDGFYEAASNQGRCWVAALCPELRRHPRFSRQPLQNRRDDVVGGDAFGFGLE